MTDFLVHWRRLESIQSHKPLRPEIPEICGTVFLGKAWTGQVCSEHMFCLENLSLSSTCFHGYNAIKPSDKSLCFPQGNGGIC